MSLDFNIDLNDIENVIAAAGEMLPPREESNIVFIDNDGVYEFRMLPLLKDGKFVSFFRHIYAHQFKGMQPKLHTPDEAGGCKICAMKPRFEKVSEANAWKIRPANRFIFPAMIYKWRPKKENPDTTARLEGTMRYVIANDLFYKQFMLWVKSTDHDDLQTLFNPYEKANAIKLSVGKDETKAKSNRMVSVGTTTKSFEVFNANFTELPPEDEINGVYLKDGDYPTEVEVGIINKAILELETNTTGSNVVNPPKEDDEDSDAVSRAKSAMGMTPNLSIDEE